MILPKKTRKMKSPDAEAGKPNFLIVAAQVPSEFLCSCRLTGLGHHFFKVGNVGSSPIRSTKFGIRLGVRTEARVRLQTLVRFQYAEFKWFIV